MKHLSAFLCSMLMTACLGSEPCKVAVLGDSYSTFEDYIPDGYAVWYWNRTMEYNDVCCVDSTWWKRLCDRNGYQLLVNSSYSGSTICNTGYNGEDYSDRSFYTRLKDITKLDTLPDVLYIFGGTNDSWAGSPLGDLKYSGWSDEDMYSTLPAFCRLLNDLTDDLPDVRIIFIMNTELKSDLVAGLKKASEHYCVDFLQLEDIDKQSGHPSNKGMRQICEQIENYHRATFRKQGTDE